MLRSHIIKFLLAFIFLVKCQTGTAQEFEAVMRKAYTLLTIAQDRDRQAAEKLDEVKNLRIRAEEDFVDAQENSKLSKKDKTNAEKQIKLLRKQEADVQKTRREATYFLSNVMDIIKGSDKKRAKFIADYEEVEGKIEGEIEAKKSTETILAAASEPVVVTDTPKTLENNADAETIVPDTPKPEKGAKKPKKEKKEPKKEPKKPTKIQPVVTKPLAKYSPQMDVALNPPAPDCVLTFDGLDPFTQRKRRETAPQILFRHTEDFMKATMAKDKEYINCEVIASRVQGGFYYINLSFLILTKEAQKSFGFLDKGTPFVFKLTNGRIVTLANTKTDIGVVDIAKNTSMYRAQLQLNSSDVKSLMESELDIFRVAWSAGYEDYEIYNMDVLQNVLKCLDKEAK
jgi:hypothetical protein